MDLSKPHTCDIQLPHGWRYNDVSNGVYCVLLYCQHERIQTPDWIITPNYEDLPRVRFGPLDVNRAKDVLKTNQRVGHYLFGHITYWCIETLQGTWQPVTNEIFWFEDPDDRILFRLTWC